MKPPKNPWTPEAGAEFPWSVKHTDMAEGGASRSHENFATGALPELTPRDSETILICILSNKIKCIFTTLSKALF